MIANKLVRFYSILFRWPSCPSY